MNTQILYNKIFQRPFLLGKVEYLARFRAKYGFDSVHISSSMYSVNAISRSSYSNIAVSSNTSRFGKENVLSRYSNLTVPCHRVVQIRNNSFQEAIESAIVGHSSIFKSISESRVVEYAQSFIIDFHDSTGLPWWLSIILSTCLVRTILTLPLALYQSYVIAKLENVRIEMDGIVNNIKYDLNRDVRKHKWPEKKAQKIFNVTVRKEWKRLIERDNCHPAKAALLALFQIPLWVILSTAFRNLVYKLPHNDTAAQLKCLELSVGGVAWFPDLTQPDHFIIPITLGLINLSIVEVQSMLYKGPRSRLRIYSTNFFRAFSLIMIPIGSTVPSCLTLYWTSSSFFGLCQNLTILSPRIRRVVGIPSAPSTHENPYKYLIDQFSNKFRK